MSDQVKYSQKLKGAKILIVGGSSGIGYGVAEGALEMGATVIITSSNQEKVDAKVKQLKQSYPSAESRVSGVVAQIGDMDSLEANVKQMLDTVGKNIDHIVHTAGDKLAIKKLAEFDAKAMVQAGVTRFYAPLMIAKYAPQHMNPGPSSSLILTTGAIADKPIKNWSVVNGYATGLQGVVRGLAVDLKPIRVNLVSPGGVMTELWDDMSEDARQQTYAHFAQNSLTGKAGQVIDIVESYLYLMKDKNVTGTCVDDSSGALLL